MTESNDKLKLFTTRMRQLILQYKDVKKENEELYAMVDARDNELKQLREQLQQSQNDYNSLKMAKMIEVGDGDIEAAKKRIASLIRESLYATDDYMKRKAAAKKYSDRPVYNPKYEALIPVIQK